MFSIFKETCHWLVCIIVNPPFHSCMQTSQIFQFTVALLLPFSLQQFCSCLSIYSSSVVCLAVYSNCVLSFSLQQFCCCLSIYSTSVVVFQFTVVLLLSFSGMSFAMEDYEYLSTVNHYIEAETESRYIHGITSYFAYRQRGQCFCK